MPRNNSSPACPFCGSSATLPFENDQNSGSGQTFGEIVLSVFLIFLVLFSVSIFLLLSRAGLPIAMVLLLAVFLLWRREREGRQARQRAQRFVCLDCSRDFKA